MARVSIENLTKLFPGPSGEAVRAVAGASFCLEEKELLVLVGPSGLRQNHARCADRRPGGA
jgi:ABC-type oligopeptide transport system ATPase subunit